MECDGVQSEHSAHVAALSLQKYDDQLENRGFGTSSVFQIPGNAEVRTAALEYTKHCPVCLAASRSKRPVKTTTKVATIFFHRNMVCVGLKYLLDSEEHRHTCGVRCVSCNEVPRGRVGKESCAISRGSEIIQVWWTLYGESDTVVVDLGGQFDSTFTQRNDVKNLGSTSASLGAVRDGSKAKSKDTVSCWVTFGVKLCTDVEGRQQATMVVAMCMHAKRAL